MPNDNENPNTTFARQWGLGGAIPLSELDADSAKVMKEADINRDGHVTMREARDRLIANSKVRSDVGSVKFKRELEEFLLEKTGRRINVTDARAQTLSHICYIQLNNAGRKLLREAQDLELIAQRDPDKPKLDTLNLTHSFNTEGNEAEASAAFRSALAVYFDGLLAGSRRLSGFIISGHSDGTYMLQETEDHMYYGNLNVRAVLREMRGSHAGYRKLMDECEKMAALACFQGVSLNEWAELFPNAALSGARAFAPLSSSRASAALYDQAATAHQVMEDRAGDAAAAVKAALQVAYSSSLRGSEPDLRVPVSIDQIIAKAKAQCAIAEAAYKTLVPQIQQIRRTGGAGVPQDQLDRAYAISDTYALTLNDLWTAQGRPGGDSSATAKEIARLKFEARDLFAIRKHLPRPVDPSQR